MRRLAWGPALALALAGIVVYLVWQTSWAYWIGGAMLIPLSWLVLTRTAEDADSNHFGDPGGGPWTGP